MPDHDTKPATMDRRQAAAYVGLSPETLRRLAARDCGPRVMKLGRARQSRVRYSVDDLDSWIASGMPTDRRGSRPAGVGRFDPPRRPAA